MKASQIKIGGVYTAKVSGRITTVRVTRIIDTGVSKRFEVVNLASGRTIVFRSAQRFRASAATEKPLRDMNADELRARMAQIRARNPHSFERLQSYRNTEARLRRLEEDRHARNENALTKAFGEPGSVTKVELDPDLAAAVEWDGSPVDTGRHYDGDELQTLAAELVSLAMFAGRAPTDNGAKEYSRQADELAQRANRIGYPSVADAIDAAKARETWAGRAEGLRAAADLVR